MTGNVVFRAKVGKQYRITIPPAERESESINIGDYVVVHIGKVQQ
jgi:bifunctional DNA-binding transcriptional regulator/antitoxin component of YhaV-PrlF toxin-antitoxin module